MSLFKQVTTNWPNTTLITWILTSTCNDSLDELHWYLMKLITEYLKIYAPYMLHICYIQNTEQITATGKAQYIYLWLSYNLWVFYRTVFYSVNNTLSHGKSTGM